MAKPTVRKTKIKKEVAPWSLTSELISEWGDLRVVIDPYSGAYADQTWIVIVSKKRKKQLMKLVLPNS